MHALVVFLDETPDVQIAAEVSKIGGVTAVMCISDSADWQRLHWLVKLRGRETLNGHLTREDFVSFPSEVVCDPGTIFDLLFKRQGPAGTSRLQVRPDPPGIEIRSLLWLITGMEFFPGTGEFLWKMFNALARVYPLS